MSDEREPLLATERGEEGTSSHPIESTEHPQPTYAAPSRVRSGRFTFLEKVLFALTVAFFILLCVFAGLYARRVYDEHDKVPAPEPTSPPDKPRENITEPLCSTPQCVLTASQILKDIDMTVDPCEDFYAYTCNNWIKTHDIPEAKPSISSFAQLATDNKEVLHGILTHDFQEFYERTHGSTGGLPDPEKLVDKQNFNKVKALYDSCMDEQAIDARGAEPLLPLLRELRRLYPSDFAAVNADTMPKATENTQTLTQAMSFLFKHNVGALFEIMIDAVRSQKPRENRFAVVSIWFDFAFKGILSGGGHCSDLV
ncbi:uncharacterized protein BYT42DRAFT_334708 [Radiomyces spectabilis]|uniref:uncharacterized protein n=1 Tax=Radiomyces spectabilis TaxID=64574 RepID=UPI0022212746|nr:uncharacterized protein BYT42DRAFT_334708 [Radiomyces spectabilis]KAI8379642.1 hypothetical protein BYT42DRAFT_334708 [Radiomyces spectabilis]